jgi:alkylation response protein AidB-like acyl-CoA dehydrogenase
MSTFGSEERELLSESLNSYFAEQYSFESRRALTDASNADGFSRDHWAEYAKLGWTGAALPEANGGAGGGMTELAIVMAASAQALAQEPLLATLALGANAIRLAGSVEHQEILSSVAAGEQFLAFCHSEPNGGYARDHVNVTATQTDTGWTLNGSKSFTLHAHCADQLIISARIAPAIVGLFLVDANTDGVERIGAASLDERRGAALELKDVVVAASALMGKPDQDRSDVISQILDLGAIAVCAEAAGAMNAVTEQTVDYLKSREQFGKPLSKMQVIQHRLVDMTLACEETRCVVHAALQAVDAGAPDASQAVWRAKVQTARGARFVGSQAIQLHGGMGMTDELAVSHYYKRLVMCETMFGDAQWYLSELARVA